MEDVEPQKESAFPGLPYPAPKGHLQIPHTWFDEIISQINNISEMKVVMYVYRHTCGFHKPFLAVTISTDEFMNGRMKSDHTRMDRGTGMSKVSVISGIKNAEEHGYLLVEVDDRDKARVRKSYRLKFDISSDVQNLYPEEETGVQNVNADVQNLYPDVQKLNTRGTESRHRTDKDKEKISQKENKKETTPTSEKRSVTFDLFMTHISTELRDLKYEEENREQGWEIFTRANEKHISQADFKRKAEEALKEARSVEQDKLYSYGYQDRTQYYFWYLCLLLNIPFKQLVRS